MECNKYVNILDCPDMSRICSACGATVARYDCHKNRYGEYICRKCQRAGIKFTWRLRNLKKWAVPAFLLSLSVAALAMWAFYRAFNSY